MLPLREVANGEPGEGVIRVHVPFCISNLALCKNKLGHFSEDPSKFTYNLTRNNLQFVLELQELMLMN